MGQFDLVHQTANLSEPVKILLSQPKRKCKIVPARNGWMGRGRGDGGEGRACGDSCLPVPMIDYYQENHTLIKSHNHLRRAEPKPRELIFDSPNFAWSLIGGPLILLEAFFVLCNKIQTWAFRFNRLLHILPRQLLSARNDGETTRPCGILLRRCCGRSLCHTSLRRHTLDAHTDTH